jgi:flagellar motor switch/type III secretory pathway protein FliN
VDEQNATFDDGTAAVQLWEPRRALRRIDEKEARLSRGFLRCRPEKWFPGFAAHWLPLAHALGCEARISEIKTLASIPQGCDSAFLGSIDGEPLVLAVDADTVRNVCEELAPGSKAEASRVVFEYLMRRLLATLALSWSGPESSAIRFQGAVELSTVKLEGSVRITFTMNTTSATVWIGFGARVVDRLDGLWRRQIQSSARAPQGSSAARIEVAQLGVPPQMLADYLKRGTVIDLEVRASEQVRMLVAGRPWMPARLVDVGGVFGCEMMPGALASPPVPEGTTRLAIEIGAIALEPSMLAELGQIGSVLITDIPVSEQVSLVINDDVVGQARLCVYEGRFAIEVS